MFQIDPLEKEQLIAFFTPISLGFIAYILATFLARLISLKPKIIYATRALFLFVFLIAIWTYCAPNYNFSGGRERWLRVKARFEGGMYGSTTLPIWLLIALYKHPNKNAPKA
jgi:hypothetical protein